MNRVEMTEWMISMEPGNPRLQDFIDRSLYMTDNKRTIDLLMALQGELKGEE